MRTEREMSSYCSDNGFAYGKVAKAAKHFEMIERNLSDDEDILLVFESNGVRNKAGAALLGGLMAVAVTTKRLIYAQRRAILGDVIKSINLNTIADISFEKGWIFNDLIIDCQREYMKFDVNKNCVEKLCNAVVSKIDEFQNKNNTPVQVNQLSVADELKKYKELLDMGVLTQEEFNAKKKQLLG